MAEALQIAGAVFGLADSALKTAKLLQRLVEVKTEARKLRDDTVNLHSLARRVTNILKERQDNDLLQLGVTPSQSTEETLESIRSSVDSCRRAVEIIHRMVRPLTEENDRTWINRIKYVWSSDLIQRQQQLIVLHLQYLGVNLSILQGLDQTRMLRAVLTYSHRLDADAQSQRTAVVRSILESPQEGRKDIEVDTLQSLADRSSGPLGEDARVSGEGLSSRILTIDESIDESFPTYLASDNAALAVAVRRKDADEVKILLEAGLDRGVRDADDWTLLHHAAYNLDGATILLLLGDPEKVPAGFIDAQDKRGRTALMITAEQAEHSKSLDVGRQLLSAQADVNVTNGGETERDALYYVVEHRKTPNRLAFATMLADEYNANIELVWKAFPEGIKDWPCLVQKVQARSPGSGGETEPAMEKLDRKKSWADRVVEKLSDSADS